MRNTGSGAREKINLRTVEFHAMCVPDIFANPPKVFGVLPRTAAKFLEAVCNVLVILRQMGMQHHTFVTGQKGRIAHQLAAHRER